ncbi:response regulator transcription factor [Reyranella sp. CPCC 100927]|uniref:response regulator transcription factor n=1 Tax=Reyranella sp. CPCC 100927 TaxID=2599616 RepID=UPI0011B82565|nr:response regulator transcription factor [Reyranella sp. CPCC 100927]TWT08694.1 response regulator transcription factor [Reyranella sp. CPCC 100927]
MRRNAVVVADDEAIRTGKVLQWLESQDVSAYGTSDQTALDMVRELKPRVVVCSDKPDGMSFCHAVRELPEPPMVVVLSEDPQLRDDVYFDGRTVIAVVRAPVRMAALSRFISTALHIAARLDRTDTPADGRTLPAEFLFHIGRTARTVH